MKGRKVVSTVLDSVDFSFYSAAEILAISVKSITNPALFDSFRTPLRGGLYDLALGPLDKIGSCATCGMNSLQCSGHCGHIDLALPVFNPLVFPAVLKLYRSICIYCHRFKMHERRVAMFAYKLELIAQGRMIEASSVSATEESFPEGESPLAEVIDELQYTVSSVESEPEIPSNEDGHFSTSSQIDAAKEVINQFFSAIPTKKCDNCSGFVPKLRKEGIGKLFQLPLKHRAVTQNKSRGITGLMLFPSLGKSNRIRRDAMELDDGNDQGADGEGRTPLEQEILRVGQDEFPTEERYLSPSEVREHLKRTWRVEERICSLIWGTQIAAGPLSNLGKRNPGPDMFFLQAILVTPSRFRPPNRVEDNVLEHPQNVFYSRVIAANILLAETSKGKIGEDGEVISTDLTKINTVWLNLQNSVTALLDSSAAIGARAEQGTGIRQLLDKKEGLFRMNMMGKRVNHACRSVISPDPYISVNEIGIPPYFATRLTYPEKVTPWNLQRLREAVENGASIHPGATHVEDEHGVVTNLQNIPRYRRNAIARTLLGAAGLSASTPSRGKPTNQQGPRLIGKTVSRHLQTGDVVLVNRQPTLHKPGIMGHRVRVLKGEKTLRMHYANCSTYNADFDGDEMNVHFPQDEIGRAEGYEIVDADQQYVVPTSGDPIRGLIQDHIVSAVLLTKRDTFLTKEMYQQLVYCACVSSDYAKFKTKKSLVGCIENDPQIRPVPPAIVKPQPLWTGKQVVTTVVNYLTHGNPPFSMVAHGKVPKDYWGRTSGEDQVMFRNNDLVCGVIDKAQFGKYGLVHSFQELYGSASAGRLLTFFSRLFTSFLQVHGFTCGIEDLLLIPKGEIYRRHHVRKADKLGNGVQSRFIGVKEGEKRNRSAKLRSKVEMLVRLKGEAASNRLDRMMSSAMNGVTSKVNNALLPIGLLKPFPGNCFSLMTTTGAKGGLVNFTQISSLLGQQELEGKRVPRMASGKTLPCFGPWDTGARAGGFISDRFLTGLRPQEYYFHCMAGRDGLVDTAVKTSRSGYLQRCLMKNLEGLKVHYDYTVRDVDGSIVQFKYGEDGIDVLKTSHLTKFNLLAENKALVAKRLGRNRMEKPDDEKAMQRQGGDASNEWPNSNVSMDFRDKLEEFLRFTYSEDLIRLKLKKHHHRDEFRFLMRLKFLESLVPPGEPVGVLAAQSVGEPSTQMTLNTFHFAGRGEMNVTLGIPRLREILMTASETISTPIMTCPLYSDKTREDAQRLATQLRRLRLVDLIERVDVGDCLISPGSSFGYAKRSYMIKLKLYDSHRFPRHLNLGLKECERVIRGAFVPRLILEMSKQTSRGSSKESAIEAIPFSKLGDDMGENANDVDEDGNPKERRGTEADGDEADENFDDEGGEDEGADAEKRRGQGNDERGYNDEEDDEERAIARTLYAADEQTRADTDDEGVIEEERPSLIATGLGVQEESPLQSLAKKSAKNSDKQNSSGVATIRQAAVKVHGSTFEINLELPASYPPLLMSEVIGTVAKEVSVRAVNGIEKCSVIEVKDKKNRNGPPLHALQTDGVNLEGIWARQDELDVNQLTTNNIAVMLRVYGVEAARATIMSEVQSVFGSYGIGVNPRHLSLISDFMTSHGGYRPCNRIGIDCSASPFLKMSYETATTFLIDATLRGQTDKLVSPSARIVLGQVVEMGTGSFDVLQNIDAFMVKTGIL